MKDYYSILGVPKNADAHAIKQAYRRLASHHHPDKGGDTTRFQEIQEAYSVLGDEQKKQQYDNPHIVHGGPTAGFDFDSIFQMFGARFADARGSATTARIQLWIGLADVVTGGPRTISVASPAGQQHIEINIPAGLEDGASIRYAKLAPGNVDLVVTFRVRPEHNWTRQDNNLIHDANVSIWDLLLGGSLQIQTLAGRLLTVTVPKHTQPGSLLRVRGHGVPNKNSSNIGDLLVRVNGRLPDQVSAELEDVIRKEQDR